MVRALRLEYAGALYHVTSRGDRREDIYEDDVDRSQFLNLFEEVCDRYNWDCHAYCLMSNHYHLVVETPDGNLSSGIRQLNGVYAQKHNQRHNKVGHVFQGRYTAILVEKETYLFELSRYVVLNPVRANMVMRAEQWPWSNYRAVVGSIEKPVFLNTTWVLSHFNQDKARAVKADEEFILAGVGKESPMSDVKNQLFLGSDTFIEKGLSLLDGNTNLSEVSRVQKRKPAKPIEYYKQSSIGRNDAIVEAYKSGAYTMKEIGECFSLSYSMVSRIVSKSRFKT